MNFWKTIMSTLLCLLGCSAFTSQVQAAGDGPYRLEVLVDHRPLREYTHRGKTYIEARKGREYAIRLTNLSGERIAVALAVDGLNTIDAKHTSAVDARKWVLAPYETIVISGWQTSTSTARRFFFTSEADSYGAWLGKTRNLGNITAAFFRERPRALTRKEFDRIWDAEPLAEMEKKGAPAQSAPRFKAEAKAESRRRDSSSFADDDGPAATGIGRAHRNEVYEVAFNQEESPSAILSLRYEFRNELIELGVFPPSPMSRRENAVGFSNEGFAPDPYLIR